MVVKVAMPQQFKLKVVPSLKGLLFPNQKEVRLHRGALKCCRLRWRQNEKQR